MRLSQSIRRIHQHSKRKISGNPYHRRQLWSARNEFVFIEIDSVTQICAHHCDNVIVWYLGISWTRHSSLVSMVYREQIVCLYDGVFRRKYARSSGKCCSIFCLWYGDRRFSKFNYTDEENVFCRIDVNVFFIILWLVHRTEGWTFFVFISFFSSYHRVHSRYHWTMFRFGQNYKRDVYQRRKNCFRLSIAISNFRTKFLISDNKLPKIFPHAVVSFL